MLILEENQTFDVYYKATGRYHHQYSYTLKSEYIKNKLYFVLKKLIYN